MGQKVHPIGIRLGIVKQHSSAWYAERGTYASQLISDLKTRAWLERRLAHASVSRIVIERPTKSVKIIVYSARPGIVVGPGGELIKKLRAQVSALMKVPPESTELTVEEVRKPDLDARLVAMNAAGQLERRVMFRRVMKRTVQNVMRNGAEGVRVQVSGRLGGSEIARTEWYREGRIPLHTLRADIDYAVVEAKTTYGVIGVKVWVFRGEIFRRRTSPDVAGLVGTPAERG